MIDRSQRNAARVAAVTYPLTFLISAIAFYRLYVPLLVLNNTAATIRNFAAHEQTFRVYLAATLAYGVGVMVLLTALYVVLKPISQGLALFATLCRLAYALMWFAQLLDLLGALRAVGGAGYLQVFDSERLQALASLQRASGGDAYYVGLGLYGLGTVVFGYLWFESGYVPRLLAAWGILSSLFMGFCAFAYLLFPSFGAIVSVNWYEIPVALFELGISAWILAKGLPSPGTKKAAEAMS